MNKKNLEQIDSKYTEDLDRIETENAANLAHYEKKVMELIKQNEELEKGLCLYIPHKFDHIDLALAQFINKYPEREKMKILFLRESSGVYQFGQSRVHVKVEKGNQVFVRVGGGYLHVKDFIELYTDIQV